MTDLFQSQRDADHERLRAAGYRPAARLLGWWQRPGAPPETEDEALVRLDREDAARAREAATAAKSDPPTADATP